MDKTKAAIVGMGLIGKAHMEALLRMPEVEVVAVCGRTDETAKAAAARYGVAKWYSNYQELIRDGGAEVIHNCTPNILHDDVNRYAIDAGKHVYAEKPLSNTAADAYEVWRRAEGAGIVHGLNHQYRMNAAVQEMRVRVQRGDTGRVFMAGGHYCQQSGLYPADWSPRMMESAMSWALADIGIHWLDTASCVLGKRLERVFASVNTVHPIREKPDGTQVQMQVNDLCCVMAVFEGGVQGMATISKVSAGHMNDLVLTIDAQECSMRWAQENPNHLFIGSKKAPNGDLQVAPFTVDSSVADLVTLPGGHPLGWNDALLAAVREYYRAVRGEIAQSAMRIATFEDGFEGMAFVEAALRSQRTGTWAEVER